MEIEEEYTFRLITLKGASLYPYSVLDSYERFTAEDSGGYTTVPVRNGDLIHFEIDESNSSYLYSVDPGWQDTLIFEGDDNILLINGKLSSITFDSIGPSLMFLHQLSLQRSNDLKIIQFTIEIPDSVKPYLQKIAEFNPHIDISFTGYQDSIPVNNQDILWISQYFSPKMLSINNLMDSLTIMSLGRFRNLETLMIFIPESIGDLALPHLEKLEKLILREWGSYEDIQKLEPSFFQENLHIKSLTYIGDGYYLESFPPWHQLQELEELNMVEDVIINYPIALAHPKLKALTVVGELIDASDISKLKHLKRLTLRLNDSSLADKLTIFSDSLQNLELLDITVVDSIFDYSILADFQQLKYLIIGKNKYKGNSQIDTSLYQLKGLKYLSLYQDFYQDSIGIVRLKNELPNTIIVPNSGACIGSIWLFMIFPLALIWFLILQALHRKKHHAG